MTEPSPGSLRWMSVSDLFGLITLGAVWLFPWFVIRAHRLSGGLDFYLIQSPFLLISISLFILFFFFLCPIFHSLKQWRDFLILLVWIVLGLGGSAFWIHKEIQQFSTQSRAAFSFGTWALVILSFFTYRLLAKEQDKWKSRTVLLVLAMIAVCLVISGWVKDFSVVREYLVKQDRFWVEFWGHIQMTVLVIGLSIFFGVAIGLFISHNPKLSAPVFSVMNLIQTIPSVAMFGMLIAPLAFLSYHCPFLRKIGVSGVGIVPALIALTLYALLPIVRNTASGFAGVPRGLEESAQSLGMSDWQIFWEVRLPLAFPVLLAGIRIATVQSVGMVTLAVLIGGPGLGIFVFQGLGQAAPALILLGVLPVVVLSVVVDSLMQVWTDFQNRSIRRLL